MKKLNTMTQYNIHISSVNYDRGKKLTYNFSDEMKQ